MNITIDFMLQMPEEHKSLLQDFNLRFYEDLSASMSRIRFVRQKMITDSIINLVICIQNFEANTFKSRRFELSFEEKLPLNEDALECPPDHKKFVVRMAGLDFLLMEQMQADIQKYVKNKSLPREKISENQSDSYKRL